MNHETETNDQIVDDAEFVEQIVRDKLADAMTPGYQAEFDPDEADVAGAFVENALSESDALESAVDLVNDDAGLTSKE